MLKTYLITIILFYLSFALLFVRCFVNKDKIKSCKDEDKWSTYIRLFILSLIPIINLLVTILFIKVSIFYSNEKFMSMASK
ncbi:hypothetical protein [Clostridium sporogenes]|uniref:hypothetical protein n=1 Tax=Clostridium sporogenes TaxID=1509 RepID=UPI0013D07AF2|nr:hypothetical protein [Clostridium sporogenes]NFP92405.1 hypothetical protein [Clostridium sporogenes]